MANTLETAVDYDKALPVIEINTKPEILGYSKGEKEAKGYNMPYNKSYGAAAHGKDYFSANMFLRQDRPKAQFVGSVDEIKDYIRETFMATTGKQMPEDISIEIVSQDELRQRHAILDSNAGWSQGIQGFSINRKGFGQSLVFVKENELDALMMVIGHEIGHVLNFQLSERLDEEAKAFAFEMEWVKAIYENNIANLRDSINPDPRPARNGLHDVAFGFVKKLLLLGKDAFDVFNELVKRKISVEGDVYG